MPQIGNLVLNLDETGTPVDVTLEPVYARKDEARWSSVSLPAVGRITGVFTSRAPDKTSGLAKYTYRFTIPTLKSIVTDPSGPYEPAPQVDYVSVGELALWLHPRATEAQRQAIASAINGNVTASLEGLLYNTAVLDKALY